MAKIIYRLLGGAEGDEMKHVKKNISNGSNGGVNVYPASMKKESILRKKDLNNLVCRRLRAATCRLCGCDSSYWFSIDDIYSACEKSLRKDGEGSVLRILHLLVMVDHG